MTTLTIEDMESKLRDLAARLEYAEESDDEKAYDTAGMAYDIQLDALYDAINTTKIITKGIRLADGTYEQVETGICAAQGCVGATWQDLDRWQLHHLPSGFLVGYLNGEREDLDAFLTGLDVLLRDVGADPESEDRTKMKHLGEQAHAYGVLKF